MSCSLSECFEQDLSFKGLEIGDGVEGESGCSINQMVRARLNKQIGIMGCFKAEEQLFHLPPRKIILATSHGMD